MRERYCLAMERIKEIHNEKLVREPFLDYFWSMASFLEQMDDLIENGQKKRTKEYNEGLYQDILPGHYEKSYASPEMANALLGKKYGPYLSFLYTQLRGIIPFAYESFQIPEKIMDITILLEAFLEVYCAFTTEEQEGNLPAPETIGQILYWFLSDYADEIIPERIKEQLDPDCDFAKKIILNADLSDPSYLYQFGEYISDNEIKTASFLNSLPEEKIAAMADTFTEGFRIGFVTTGKDLSKKKVVNIRYCLGFERVVKRAIVNFEKMGLETTIYRAAVHAINKSGSSRVGYYGAIPNRQYDFDHKEDLALFLDKALIGRKLELLKLAYEHQKHLAAVHAGPAVMETFGELPFTPQKKKESLEYSKKQQQLLVEYTSEAGQIVNQYIKGEERSFTIISYPVPDIGEQFEQIFAETVTLNTLDYKKYQTMQQAIIDVLDQGEKVQILGNSKNRTNLVISLRNLKDAEHETQFENCVADVNIPVGEVFTSPVLKGTTGSLFVSEVYLNGLRFENLELDFVDGMVRDYSCTNFETEEDNRKYIFDHVLFRHELLPMGEFAIGTNTTAYAMAKKYQIFSKLPILIAEKTGPHFAVGDTCYSHAEDIKVYNPDGKEIISRDNEISLLRRTDEKKAYFNCHTDITIPYDELASVIVYKENGEQIPVIMDGKFALADCLSLNEPLETLIDADKEN